MIVYHTINLYFHERIAAITKAAPDSEVTDVCLTSLHGILEFFLKLTPSQVSVLPVFQIAHVSSAMFTLVKMSKTTSRDDLKTQLYLDGVLALHRASVKQGYPRGLYWHLVLLTALDEYLHEGKTPLDVLSDVAMKSPHSYPPTGANPTLRFITAGERFGFVDYYAFLTLMNAVSERMGGTHV